MTNLANISVNSSYKDSPYCFVSGIFLFYIKGILNSQKYSNTPQPLYNTIVGVQANFRVGYPINVIMRVKCIDI